MRKTKILLVNGDSTVQQLRALMLRLKGHHVDTTGAIEEAWRQLSNADYKLVIVDVGHFAEPGLAFCEELKKKYPKQGFLMQVDHHLFLYGSTWPDKVVSKADGPQHFVSEVEAMLQGAA